MLTDIEIARQATLIPITEVAKKAGVPEDALIPYGKYKAKIDTAALPTTSNGKLILVTAVNPTPAGEGKTTTSVGLSDALHRIGKSTLLCLLRRQGRRRRRRQEPGHADGRNQPALHG
jgi:formate--tetrahydrofolate ligase